MKNDSSRRGSLVSAGVSECGCWGQVKIIVTNQLEDNIIVRAGALLRRLSGVTSWVCRVQNGQLSSQPGPGHDTLADITHILRPDLRGGSEQGREAARGEVQRSNSSPSIGDLATPAAAAAARLEKCATISEEADPGTADPELQPVARPRAVTFSSSPASTPASAPRVSSVAVNIKILG